MRPSAADFGRDHRRGFPLPKSALPSRHVVCIAGLALAMCALFVFAHGRYPGVPSVGETGGWRDWNDQGLYLRAAQAWQAGNLAKSEHWYPPGYALMGSVFSHVTPRDRFLLPNLACLLVCLFACASLAFRLYPRMAWARCIGAAAFLVASVGTLPGLKSWLVPWTTTPATACILVALVAVLRLADRPGLGRALAAGGALGAIVLFRPGDAMPVMLASGLVMLPVLWRLGLRRASLMVAAAFAGFVVPAGIAFGLVAVTTGFGPDTYYGQSGVTGFEWRLLPLRFVSLVLDARPLFDGVGAERGEAGQHRGLAEVFVWMLPGLAAGMALCARRRALRVHVLLAVWAAAHLALMLCYRDLHILGFWPYGNTHYFKATQPVLLLLALAIPAGLLDRSFRLREIAVALAALAGLACWRAELVAGDVVAEGFVGDFSKIDAAGLVPGHGSWIAFYSGAHRLQVGGAVFRHNDDFKLYPRTGDFLVVPLRPLPKGEAVLTTGPGVAVGPAPARQMRQAIVFGLPCLFGLAGRICGQAGAPAIE